MTTAALGLAGAVSSMRDRAAKIREVIEREEFMVRTMRSDIFREELAYALRRAGVRDEAQMVANALLTREESAPLPTTMADGVVAYLTQFLEHGIGVRRAMLGRAEGESAGGGEQHG